MIYATTDDLSTFYQKWGELSGEGKKPHWFSLQRVYFICSEDLLKRVIKNLKP